MTDDIQDVAAIRRLLGPSAQVPVPADLDQRILLLAGRLLLRSGAPAPHPAGPPAIAWVLLATAAAGAVAVAVFGAPYPALPHCPAPAYCLAAVGYLATLLAAPVILLRRRRQGVHHG